MRLSETRQPLVRAEVLAAKSLAAGFPLWLPFGSLLADRFDEVYREELRAATDFLELEPPLLIEETRYETIISGSYEYRNMYSLELEGRSYLVRPDALVTTAQTLRAQPSPLPVVMQGGFYRAETGSLHPLLRDRHVWRVTEVVHWLDDDPNDEMALMHVDVFRRFMVRLGIPTVYVESPPLREHSRRRLLTYTCPSPDEVTLTSTLYVLTPALSDALGLGGTVIDFGFTAKLLACATALHADAVGFLCTSSVAPHTVVVGFRRPEERAEADRLASVLGDSLPRVVVDPGPWHSTLRRSRRRGTPVLVLADSRGESQLIRRIDGSSEPLPLDAAGAVRDALRAHDRVLAERARRHMDEAIERAEVIRFGAENAARGGWFHFGCLLGVDDFPRDGRLPLAPAEVFGRQRRLY